MTVPKENNVKGAIIAKSTLLGNVNSIASLQGSINNKSSLVGYAGISQIIKDDTRTFILVDENGNELAAVLVDEPVEITATPNDIRIGTTAVTGDGVVEGTREIPSYHTSFGWKVITAGSKFVLYMQYYDYTKLQVLFCPFNTTLADSVAVDKVVIDDNVYISGTTDVVSTVVIDDNYERVDFGINNESNKPYILRYSSYKEIY